MTEDPPPDDAPGNEIEAIDTPASSLSIGAPDAAAVYEENPQGAQSEPLALPELALIICLIALVAGSFSIIYWPLVQMMLHQFGAAFSGKP